MADWKAIYSRAKDMELERIRALVARKEAEEQENSSSRDTVGTTTTLQEEKPLTAESTADTVRRVEAE